MKKRILLLDDDPVVARTTSRILSRDFDISVYHRGVDALDALRGNLPIDAIVSDMDLGDMWGTDFYRAAIGIRPELSGRFVFYSGSPDIPKTDVPLITKPADDSLLRDTVQGLVS
jgi:CheY-like chemotaxis protein